MADIFLSYSRVDRPTAQIIAEALEAEGFSVWWDKVLRAGQTYDEVTETMLRDSHVVIVLWSQTSVKSTWVRAEATQGQRNCVLVPAMIEDAERPIMFELTQTADLIGWAGDRSDERWVGYVDDLKRALEKPKPTGAMASEPTPKPIPEPTPVTAPKADPAPARPAAAAETPAPASAVSQDPQPAPASPAKKKSSNPLPLLLGILVLGAGGWFGYQTFMSDQTTNANPTPGVNPPTCDVCPEMVSVKRGKFLMGSPDDEANRTGNEGPQREVDISGFFIAESEITRGEWQHCVDAGVCGAVQGSDDPSMPVTGINWDDAVGYAEWLSQTSGHAFRLPTESEWEYVARGGTTTAYWWGTSYPGPGASEARATSVDGMSANAFGVAGMLGNVREWVADCYVNNYREAPTDGRAVRTGDCQRPVVRGGSFKTAAAEHRAASRARYSRSTKDSGLGFRVAAD
ncbi:MAG: SUMF1/EgtB/PvdO family nonheme iron enzyme [Pseudomonadota bacterium]